MFDSDSEDYNEEIVNDKIEFTYSRTIEDLKTNNIKYLKRELKSSCYNDSLPLISKSLENTLIGLNEFDFITSTFKLGVPDYLYDGEKYHHTDNRSYLIGLIDKEDYKFFKEEISIYYPSLNAIVYNNKSEKIHPVSLNVETKQLYEFHYLRPSINCSSFVSCSNVYPELQDKYVEILVQDLEWNNREYLFNSMLNIMKLLSF